MRFNCSFPFLSLPILVFSSLSLVGCGGGSSDDDQEITIPDNEYSISGSVSGLSGTLVLQETVNGTAADELSLASDGDFSFPSFLMPQGVTYSVAITSQPDGQSCSLSDNSSGTLGDDTAIDISVVCTPLPTAATVALSYGLKQFKFSWDTVAGATYYQLYENADGHSGFTLAADDITDTSYALDVVLYNKLNAQYLIAACNDSGDCADSNTVTVSNNLVEAIGYFKASNAGIGDEFGSAVAISGDGQTLVVGAEVESGDADSTVESPNDNGYYTGAAYVFAVADGQWVQQAYLKAENAGERDLFGRSIAISKDGNIIAIGAPFEAGDEYSTIASPNDNAPSAGAVYIFNRTNSVWSQQAYLKASNADDDDNFGTSIALSADGQTLAVGAPYEDGDSSSSLDNSNTNADSAGAVYVFQNINSSWVESAYLKASNAQIAGFFGLSVDISDDGSLIAIGAPGENGSSSSTVESPNDYNGAAGAVYVFSDESGSWLQKQYLKADDAESSDSFGSSVAIAGSGTALVSSSPNKLFDSTANSYGCTYVFTLTNDTWSQQATFNGRVTALAMSVDGDMFAIGNYYNSSDEVGISEESDGGDDGDYSGAVTIYRFSNDAWQEDAFIKASNSGGIWFGSSLDLADDGTLLVGAVLENNDSTEVSYGVEDSEYSLGSSGAAYLY